MNLVRSPNRWSCLAVSFAMVMDVTLYDLIAVLGHDGSEILWPELPEPKCRRGFHPDELIAAAYLQGNRFVPLIPTVLLLNEGTSKLYQRNTFLTQETVGYLIQDRRAVLLCSQISHAVAWDGDMIYDPKGCCYDLGSFPIYGALIEV